MEPTLQPNLKLLYNDGRLGNLLDALDELHSAASEGALPEVTTLNDADLIGWLYELIYTAQETIHEIKGYHQRGEPALSLVRRDEAS